MTKRNLMISPDVWMKFKEHNQKLKDDAIVMRYVHAIIELLELRGQVDKYHIEDTDRHLTERVAKSLTNSGWSVSTNTSGDLKVWLE